MDSDGKISEQKNSMSSRSSNEPYKNRIYVFI